LLAARFLKSSSPNPPSSTSQSHQSWKGSSAPSTNWSGTYASMTGNGSTNASER
jgi:hypothetical protein